MRKKLISLFLFLLLSAFSFAEVREIEMIGPRVVEFPRVSSNENKKINQRYEEAPVLRDIIGNFQEEYIVGMREYRPQVLINIDEKIADKNNRWILKSLNADYDRELKNYLERISYDSKKIFFLANQYMIMNDYEKANKIFLLDSKDFKNIFGAATTFRFLGRNEEAVHKYSQAISRNSGFSESYLGRALANRNLENYESAVEDLKTYIAMSSRLEGYLALGDLYFKLEKKKEAQNIVGQGLSKYPNSKLLKTLANNIYRN